MVGIAYYLFNESDNKSELKMLIRMCMKNDKQKNTTEMTNIQLKLPTTHVWKTRFPGEITKEQSFPKLHLVESNAELQAPMIDRVEITKIQQQYVPQKSH